MNSFQFDPWEPVVWNGDYHLFFPDFDSTGTESAWRKGSCASFVKVPKDNISKANRGFCYRCTHRGSLHPK